MKIEASEKQEQIVEAAIKRFSHFGINKTTLAEIADDLSISKPSLFYYFSDKGALIVAVASKIINETLDQLEQVFEKHNTIDECLLGMVEVKRNYFKKYALLAMQSNSLDTSKIPDMSQTLGGAFKRTEDLVADLLQNRVETRHIPPADSHKVAKLFLETMMALECGIKMKNSFPSVDDVEALFDRQRELVTIFLNGIKAR